MTVLVEVFANRFLVTFSLEKFWENFSHYSCWLFRGVVWKKPEMPGTKPAIVP